MGREYQLEHILGKRFGAGTVGDGDDLGSDVLVAKHLIETVGCSTTRTSSRLGFRVLSFIGTSLSMARDRPHNGAGRAYAHPLGRGNWLEFRVI